MWLFLVQLTCFSSHPEKDTEILYLIAIIFIFFIIASFFLSTTGLIVCLWMNTCFFFFSNKIQEHLSHIYPGTSWPIYKNISKFNKIWPKSLLTFSENFHLFYERITSTRIQHSSLYPTRALISNMTAFVHARRSLYPKNYTLLNTTHFPSIHEDP